jgi:hypothetical protein
MLPGISAEDCLYADLGVDPGATGCLSYEATDFLLGDHKLDPACSVILWQVDCVGDPNYHEYKYGGQHVPRLVSALLRFYPADHTAYLYSAPMLCLGRPKIHPIKLGSLAEELKVNRSSGTLYIPPLVSPTIDLAMAARLGIPPTELSRRQTHEVGAENEL